MLLLLFYQREGFKRFLCMSRYGIGLGLAAAAAFYTGNNYVAVKNSIAIYTELMFSIKLMILKYIWGLMN